MPCTMSETLLTKKVREAGTGLRWCIPRNNFLYNPRDDHLEDQLSSTTITHGLNVDTGLLLCHRCWHIEYGALIYTLGKEFFSFVKVFSYIHREFPQEIINLYLIVLTWT